MDGLEIRENIDEQHRAWRFERVGWLVLLLILVGATLGVFGSGVFGTAEASTPDGLLRVEFPRFLRAQSPQRLRAWIEPQRQPTNRFTLWFSAAYLADLSLQRVMPPPARVVAGRERITFEFESDGGAEPIPVTFEFVANESGAFDGTIGSDLGAIVFRQFVYP
jgi:hypothetical protein